MTDRATVELAGQTWSKSNSFPPKEAFVAVEVYEYGAKMDIRNMHDHTAL
jgi:hypothetical protein